MSLANTKLVSLNYGVDALFSYEIDASRIPASLEAPRPNPHFIENLENALANPIDFPPLEQSLISGDQIVLALDRGVPQADQLIAAAWKILASRDVSPDNVVILQPAGAPDEIQPDPRTALPEDIQKRVAWKIHNPADKDLCAYLSATLSGERIYLARELVDFDIVVSIGRISYDPLIGYRGTNSVFYPALSESEAIHKTQGVGHRELDPDDTRPLRQMMDEVGWLMGTQFTIQVIASASGGVCEVLAGAIESVFRKGRELLAENWLIQLESRPEIVVAAVEIDAGGHHWEQVATAIAMARSLVAQGGKILILSELNSELGPGLELLRGCELPHEVFELLREISPVDYSEASQIAYAADWANIYIMSKLDSDLVEDLFMIPVANESEATRLLSGEETCLFVGSAQFAYGTIGEA